MEQLRIEIQKRQAIIQELKLRENDLDALELQILVDEIPNIEMN